MATVTGDPAGYGTTEWTNPANAYTDNTVYASCVSPGKNLEKNGIWTTFGITDPGGGAVITKVEIGTQHYLSIIASIIATMGREISWDGGSTWSATDHALPEAETETLTEVEKWVDVTSDTAWTWAKLNDTNLQVRISCKQGNDATGFTMDLDVVFVRVTYVTVTTYSVTKDIASRVKAQGILLTKDAASRVKAFGISLTKDIGARVKALGVTIDKISNARVGPPGGPTTYEITKNVAARVLGNFQIQKQISSRVKGTVSINKAIQACVDWSTPATTEQGSWWRR
jgi:hypothetical protein